MLLFTLLPRWQRLLLALLLALALTSLLCARPAQAQLSLVGARAPLGPVVTTPYVQAELVAHAPQGVAADYMGAFAVTAGIGADKQEAVFAATHDDYGSIMFKALADRLAEAFAECLHQRVRTDLWGYAADETLSNEQLIAEKYVGIRPAPGYPACPDHRVKRPLFELLRAEDIGMGLTDSYAMTPASSVSGFYFSHPDSSYFSVGKINEEQVQDMAERSAAPLEEVERALAPNLGL